MNEASLHHRPPLVARRFKTLTGQVFATEAYTDRKAVCRVRRPNKDRPGRIIGVSQEMDGEECVLKIIE
jgi:hypothetical protein